MCNLENWSTTKERSWKRIILQDKVRFTIFPQLINVTYDFIANGIQHNYEPYFKKIVPTPSSEKANEDNIEILKEYLPTRQTTVQLR